MLGARIRTRLRRKKLDDDLARGGDPAASPERRLRAEQLNSPGERLKLANTLVEALGGARMNHLGPFRRKLRERDAAIRGSAEELLALARRLRDGEPIEVRGAAMAARLVRDRASPFNGPSVAELRAELCAAYAALDSPGEPMPEAADAAPELIGRSVRGA